LSYTRRNQISVPRVRLHSPWLSFIKVVPLGVAFTIIVAFVVALYAVCLTLLRRGYGLRQ